MQMELFPTANKSDMQAARSLLNRYTRMRKAADILASRPVLTEKEEEALGEYQKKADSIEMAVKMIIDDDVRRVMEFRFIRGNTRWGTVSRFNTISDRSVDRRIVRGVESVAETLKVIGII
ncbi:hypothetical protein [Paenibacillus massiliensis]|uniref:hypothetical protein n=1 Tax=Paenibacillus massiliensis TaxID=225917 RepID=UPI00047214C1|nr:hypothetical protein [Paenibacillus massiliensis]